MQLALADAVSGPPMDAVGEYADLPEPACGSGDPAEPAVPATLSVVPASRDIENDFT